MEVDELAEIVRSFVETLLNNPNANFPLDSRNSLQECKTTLDGLLEHKKDKDKSTSKNPFDPIKAAHETAKEEHETGRTVHESGAKDKK